jgi:hypothetical protein
MGRAAQVIGGASIVLAPVLMGVADELRMAAEPPESGTLVDSDWGVRSVLASLDVIEQHRGLFLLAGALSYAAVPLVVVALVAIWRASVARSPRWAWAGAIVAALGALGLMVHLLGYYGQTLTALDMADRTAAAEFIVASEGTGLVIAFFVPFFLTLISPLVQGVGLWRARVVPLWALLCLAVGAVVLVAVGSTPWSTALSTALLAVGFAPAALTMLRGAVTEERTADRPGAVPATA